MDVFDRLVSGLTLIYCSIAFFILLEPKEGARALSILLTASGSVIIAFLQIFRPTQGKDR